MVRVKQRYYLLEIISKDFLSPSIRKLLIEEWEIHRAVKDAVLYIHGDYGVGMVQAGLCVKMYNPLTRVCIIRVRRAVHKLVGSALPFVQNIGNEQAFFRIIHLGGTIRSCLKFLIKFDQEQLTILNRRYAKVFDEKKIRMVCLKTRRKLENEDSGEEDDLDKT